MPVPVSSFRFLQAAGLRRCVLCSLACALLLLACSPAEEKGNAPADTAADTALEAEEIDWFQGSIDAAFAHAEARAKPIFLYWGAEWCPPCHELKATIFSRPEFIRQSRLFVPVYLDGDTERAQQYGEKFAVMGYPTVVILSPRGEEITRIPGGMDIQQYTGIMDEALNSMQPVSELLAVVEAGDTLDAGSWQMLSHYSWQQDGGRVLREQPLAGVARQLASSCPAELALDRSLLRMLAVVAWAQSSPAEPTWQVQYREWTLEVLSAPALARANLSQFAYYGDTLLESLSKDEQARQALAAPMLATLEAAIADSGLGVLTRLDALYGKVSVLQALQEQLTPEQRDLALAQAAELRAGVNSYQLHPALYSLAGIYHLMHEEAATRAVLDEGLEKSKQPYYFMAVLADLERETGNDAAALDWYRRAWEQSRGPATRLQWGVNYFTAQLELSPDDLAAIEHTGRAVLGELSGQPAALHQRNASRVQRMGEQLYDWQQAAEDATEKQARRAEVIGHLRKELDGICQQQSGLPAVCASFAGGSA